MSQINANFNGAADGETEGEISLADIVEFIQESWKQLVFAGIAGAILGFGGWYFLGIYKAELILLNNTNTYGLDLVTWRTLQKSLPSLANQRLADKKLSPEQIGLYQQMREPIWWSKNVISTYAISKADTKDLAAISKDLDSASTTILSLNILASANSKEGSLENVRLASVFLKTGGAFLQVKSLLNGYEGEVIGTVAKIQSQITSAEIEQAYLRDRAKSLEDLHKRFPGSANVGQQFVDLKDSGAKYLPITTQIIAVKNDINQNKEKLVRLNDHLNQIALFKTFLTEAVPMAEQELDGILLSKSLLTIEEKLRKNLAPGDIISRQALDQLRAQLLTIEARFAKGLEANIAPITKKTGMLKTTAAGIAITGFLMLAFLLGRKIVRNLKPRAQ
jgi:hypothetical protein